MTRRPFLLACLLLSWIAVLMITAGCSRTVYITQPAPSPSVTTTPWSMPTPTETAAALPSRAPVGAPKHDTCQLEGYQDGSVTIFSSGTALAWRFYPGTEHDPRFTSEGGMPCRTTDGRVSQVTVYEDGSAAFFKGTRFVGKAPAGTFR